MLGMITVEAIGLIVLSTIAIPWLVFITKTTLSIRAKQAEMHTDIQWTRSEHEAVDGVQSWKNPGFVSAVDKLSSRIDKMGDSFLRVAMQMEKESIRSANTLKQILEVVKRN